MSLEVGDIISFERTFSVRDVELFTEISGKEGIHLHYLKILLSNLAAFLLLS